MTIFVPIFLLTFLVTVGLIVRLAYLVVRQQRSVARKTAIALTAIVGGYGVVLVATGLGSRKQALALGAIKCFDDWCVQVNSFSRKQDHLQIHLQTVNHGRRSQAPDSPRAFVVLDDQTIPVDVPSLTNKIEGGSIHPVDVNVPVPANVRNLEFVVTEGGGPSTLIIDDEDSPFHAKSGWNLSTTVY